MAFTMRTSCPWKATPVEFGSGSNLHRYFQAWEQHGVLWRQGLLEYDQRRGIPWRWLSLDGAMTKTPLGRRKKWSKPDRSRQVRYETMILADARGVVLGIAIGPANRHDIELALPTLENIPIHRPQPTPYHLQHLCADKAYDSEKFSRVLKRRHYIPTSGRGAKKRSNADTGMQNHAAGSTNGLNPG